MLARLIDRVRRATTLDGIVIATTVNATDDALAAAAEALGAIVVRGDEHDVLGRYVLAASTVNADAVVRITADCPLIDPTLIDRVVTRLLDTSAPVDYASNTITRTFPRGLDVEAMHRDVLTRIARFARSRPAREHVTYFLHRERPELFDVAQITDPVDNSDLRWTVDTPEDLELAREIYARAKLTEQWVAYDELVAIVRRDPVLQTLNSQIQQKVD